MSALVAKRVTQETFDETVLENMEEFEMTRDEALKDAVEQFKSQGIDLSSLEREKVASALETIQVACNGGVPTADILAALEGLTSACEHEAKKRARANRAAVLAGGGLKTVVGLTRACVHDCKIASVEVAIATARALRACVRNDAENREAARGAGCVVAAIALVGTALERGEADLLIASLELVTALCARTEQNKAVYFKARGGDLLVRALSKEEEEAPPKEAVVVAACDAMCAITMADDVRSNTSCTFDVSKQLVASKAVEALLECCAAYGGGSAEEAFGAVLSAMRQLAKSDDCVKLLRKRAVLELCGAALKRATVDVQVVGLLRNMASNDDAKDDMCNKGILELLCEAVVRREAEPAVVEHALATFAAMALRRPNNAVKIAQCGGIDLVLGAMRRHVGVDVQAVNLQRQGCLAIRNLVARSDGDLTKPLLDAGSEAVLRAAAAMSQANVDVAYAALRDLGIDAKIQTFEPDAAASTGIRVVEKDVFGSGAAANFRAIFDESADVAAQIAAVDELTDAQTKLSNFAVM